MPTYTYDDFTIPGSSDVEPRSINASGDVVGFYIDTFGNQHGFSLESGVLTSIDVSGASRTSAADINNSGEIVGDYTTTSDGEGAFTDVGGNLQAIVIPNGVNIDAFSLNDAGQVTGEYDDTTTSKRLAFIYKDGQYTAFQGNFANVELTEGVDINNAGEVLADYEDTDGHSHYFIYSGGGQYLINAPGAADGTTQASAINNLGEVTGTVNDGATHLGFVENNGSYTEFGIPGATFIETSGINDSGVVSGSYTDASSNTYSFLEQNGIVTVVSDAQHPNAIFHAINDAGEVTGSSDSNHIITGFTATPAGSGTSGGTGGSGGSGGGTGGSGGSGGSGGGSGGSAPPVSDMVAIGQNAAFVGQGVFVLSGTASSTAGVKSVEISAKVDGTETDLGAASVKADGTWTFADHVGRHVQGFITATETDAAGGTATDTPATSLEAGIRGQSYVARQDFYTPDGSGYTASVLEHADLSRTVEVEAPAQSFASQYYDTFANAGQGSSTFVFKPGYGSDEIKGFRAGGATHDTIALPSADFANFAAVLHDTQNTAAGAVIHDPTSGDTLLIAGVSKALLAHNPADVSFHA